MSTKQLNLFPEPSEAVENAIDKLSSVKALAPNYAVFVRELGLHMTTKPSGSLIIAAVPNRFATSQACASLEDYLEAAKRHGHGGGKADLLTLEIPHAHNVRAQQTQLADIYSGLQLPRRKSEPEAQFTLDIDSGFSRPTPIQRICRLIRDRTAEYYLVRDAHYLSPSGGSIHDGINQVRFFIQLAHRSKKTHVLFTNPLTVRDWLTSGEINGEVTDHWLRPYNKRNTESYREFKGILKGYDAVIPRDKDFTLLKHADNIYGLVWGCTYRLNKWAINTLVSVRARDLKVVTWDDFLKCQPSPEEQKHARSEFLAATRAPTTAAKGDTQEGTSENPCLPGQRTLGRDSVAQHDNAA